MRWTEIDEAILMGWLMLLVALERRSSDERWLGQFTPRGIPLVMAGRQVDYTAFFFTIAKDYRLRKEGVLLDPLLP